MASAALLKERRLTNRDRRAHLEAALDRLLGAVDGLLMDLDAVDGDPDLEPLADDDAACEDEGFDSDSEPDDLSGPCHWPDEGDQTMRPAQFC